MKRFLISVLIVLGFSVNGADIDYRSLRPGDFITNGGYVATTTWTNANGQMTLKTNIPIFVDYTTVGTNAGTTIGAEFDIDPLTGGTIANPDTYALAGFNGFPPLAASGIENNTSGQKGVAGGALLYSGTITNGLVAGVVGITERAHSMGIGTVGTSFGQAGTTNVGVSGSAQGGAKTVGGYFETLSGKSSAIRPYLGSALIANTGDTTNWIFQGLTNGARIYNIRGDGSVFVGKNAGQVWNFNSFAGPTIGLVSMVNSNEPPEQIIELQSIGDQNFGFYSQASLDVSGNKDTAGFANLNLERQGTNANNQQRFQISMDPSASFGLRMQQSNVDVLVSSKGGDLTKIKAVTYSWPTAHGVTGSVLTDTNSNGILDWQPGLLSTAGTNEILSLVTNGINNNARIGPGTNNFFAKFNVVGGTNVGNAPMRSTATNLIEMISRADDVSHTNENRFTIYGEWTNPTNYQRLSLIGGKGHANSSHFLIGEVGPNGVTDGVIPLNLYGTWNLEPTNPISGHSAGFLSPNLDDGYNIGSSSSRVHAMTIGTSALFFSGTPASRPSIKFSNATGIGQAGGAGSAAMGFYRSDTDVGCTAQFNSIYSQTTFDLGSNLIGFGIGVSNVASWISCGDQLVAQLSEVGLIQIGTNSGVASPLAVGIAGAPGVGSNKGGSDLRLIGGPGAGTAKSGDVRLQTSEPGASSSSINTPIKDRLIVASRPVTLTESTATLVFNVALASGKFCGIRVHATTDADDATNFQCVTEDFVIAAVNKGGTVTNSLSASAPIATVTTSGTLTTAWTAVANGNSLDVKCNAVSSLTQTTLKTRWRVELDGDGTLVVVPQ